MTAVYGGDANDSAATTAELAEVIEIAPTASVVVSSLNPAGLGAVVTLSATVTTQGGTPTGSVQFFDGANPLGTSPVAASGGSSGMATMSTSGLGIGAHAITAVYSGDALDATSTSTALTENIQAATTAITLGASGNPTIFGAPLTFTAKVTGTGSTPTGTVALLDGGTTVETLAVPANGVVAFVNPSLAIGAHTLTASYSGDMNHGTAASNTITETIEQATTTGLSASAAAVVAGKPVTVTAVVTGVSGKAFTGNVSFTDGGLPLATVAPDATGMATYATSALKPGQHVIMASYAGDTLDAASASTTVAVVVTIASTTTTLTTSANPIYSGSALTLSSTVTGNGGMPTGTVTFLDGGTAITAVQVSATGTATFTVSTLAPGVHQLSASYSGDALDAPSVSPTTSEQIAQKTSVSLRSSANPSLLQDNVLLTISVSNGAPSVPPTGAVTLTDVTTTLGTMQLSATGTASYTMQTPTVGTHSLVVSYAGDNGNSPASSQALIQTVTLRPSTASFNPSATSLSSGQGMTLISVVQASGSRPATGTVAFMAGSTLLGTATVDATGLATLNLVPPQGTLNTVAEYSGDSLYAPSDSAAVSIVVGPTVEYTIALTPASLSMASGSRATLQVDIATAKTFSDTLALGCAGLPEYATCTFSTNEFHVGAGVSQTVSVTVDTGAPLGSGTSARNVLTGGMADMYACALPLGALLAALIGFNRRRLGRLNLRLALTAIALLLGAGSTMLSGCASNLNVGKTAAGSYSFKIIASGNKTGVTQTAITQLTVTK